ncbi:hypothetical protein EVJ58_g7564, partial [Rhodofomes roseus]
MVDERSDILGGHLQKAPGKPYKAWLAEHPTGTAAFAVVFSLLSYFVLIPAFNRWQDRRALRRRYGIPDDDERPFNIAYAAVRTRTHGGSEEGSREASEQLDEDGFLLRHGSSDVPMLVRRPLEGEELARFREPEVPRSANHAPYVSQYDPRQVAHNAWLMGQSATLVEEPVVRHYVHTPAQREADSSATISPGTLSDATGNGTSPPALKTQGKHAREDDEAEKPEKKSRLAGEVDEGIVVDGDDDMEVEVEVVQPKRGAKRQADVDDDEGIEHVRTSGRDKRVRRQVRERAYDASDEEMAEVQPTDEDEVTEMQPVYRGKKRDRDEAGSTFGGDESIADELDSEDGRKSRRRRKRRAMAKKVEDPVRGQKRSRDDASEESEEEPERPKRRITRRQRGNRDPDPLFDAPLSNDPLCKGRRIGEEWEVNEIRYKVGPNGQRLRQDLVKRSRTRFPMPKDSQHADRRANIDVYVETWLTEEEYQAAKEHGDLAWQDSPSPSVPATPGDVSDYPSGKSLLWASEPTTPESPAPQRGPFRQSIVTNVGLRLNPFRHSQVPPNRRVTSAPQLSVASTPEPSPAKPRTVKTYSKWEKQDLEAAAMSKIREKKLAEAREARKAIAPPQTATQPSIAPAGAAPATSSAPAVLTFTSAKPDEKAPEKQAQQACDKPASSFSFGTLPAPSSSNATPASNAAPGPAHEAQKNFFNIAPPSTSATPASTTAQPPSSVPNFFIKNTTTTTPQAPQPSTQPSIAPSAPSASSFMAKPASATPASTSAPSFDPFGGAANTTQPSTAPAAGAAPKSAFSFAPPSATSTSKPAETGPTEQTTAARASSGPSLLARLGPQVQAPSSTQPQTSTPASGSAPQPLKFSFTQPSAPAAGALSQQQPTFAQPSTPASAATASTTPASTPAAASSNTSTAAAKFNFGFTGANTGSSAPAAPAASTTPTAAGATDTSKPFSF